MAKGKHTKSSTTKKNKQTQQQPYLVYAGIALIAVLVVLVLVQSNRPAATQEEIGEQVIAPEIARGVTDTGLPYLGEEDAPVTLLEYEDFGCHNCRDFVGNVEPKLIEEYIKEGKVKLVSYPVAFVNAQSLPGAEAAACSAEQGKYWEYRHLLFANQGSLAFNRTNLLAMAESASLDVAKFTTCIDSRRYQSLVIDRTEKAQSVGIGGTPTFEISGKRYEGVLPYESDDAARPGISNLIEEALLSK